MAKRARRLTPTLFSLDVGKNLSDTERLIRGWVGVTAAAMVAAKAVPNPWEYILAVAALFLGFTALYGYCPIYSLFTGPARKPGRGRVRQKRGESRV